MSLAGYNTHDHQPLADREPVPAGEYEVMITASEWRDNSSSNGRHLVLTLQIIEGEHEGRLLWDRLNLENDNQSTVQIAQRAVSSICRACGFSGTLQTENGEELHNRPMRVKVAVDPPKGEWGPKNKITRWIHDATPAGGKAPSKATAASGGKPTPPWKR